MTNIFKLSFFRNPSAFIIVVAVSAALMGCASKVLKSDQAEAILRSADMEEAIDVREIPAADSKDNGLYVLLPGPEPVPSAFPAVSAGKPKRVAKTPKTPSGKLLMPAIQMNASEASAAAMAKMAHASGSKHEPAIEDGAGFIARRPAVDPFRVGEKVTLEVSYFSVVAGDMTVETRGFAEVNGRKSYRFAGTAKSTSVFALFYAIDDWYESFVDFETLVPAAYALHVKETKQIREVRTIFDWVTRKGRYIDKKINDEQQLEEKNEEWDIPDYSQNVFSAVYYLRTFKLVPGFKTQIRVAHEGKNLILNAEVVRREKISTPAGDFNTVVIKPTISLDGKFSPVGDIFVWLTDDDRKFLVRIESKLKIGKVVGVAKALELGKP